MNKEIKIIADTQFVLAALSAGLSGVTYLFMPIIGGKAWLVIYLFLFSIWLLSVVASAFIRRWTKTEWILQLIIFLICFSQSVPRTFTYVCWSINGFAP